MQAVKQRRLRQFGNRFFRILLCGMLFLQTLGVPGVANAVSAVGFQGYDHENVSSSTFTYGSNGASVSGTTVSFTAVGTGEAIGYIALNEEGGDLSTAIDLGGLEIDFSTVATTALEEDNASEVDVASAQIKFCGESGNVLKTVSLQKSNPAVAGSETLMSGVSIPAGAREIFIYLYGTSASGSNTVVFSGTSLVIHDSSAPSCGFEYNSDWTNQPVAVRINAADSDSGLEGIYLDDRLVSQTAPYDMIVSENNSSFSAYSMDNAGKKSEVQTITVANIDITTPAAPASLSLSAPDWTNEDVSLILPSLSASTGAPERYVYQIGASAWTDLPDGFALSDNGTTTIRVAVADAAGNRSGYLQAAAKIDKLAPVIDTLVSSVSSGSCRVDLTYHDEGLSGLQSARYAQGTQSADYFTTGGNAISGGSFTVHVGGDYTICVLDNAGNATLRNLTLSTAPTLGNLENESIEEDSLLEIPLVVSDAESPLEELSIHATTDDTALLPNIQVNRSESAASIVITPGANRFGGPAAVTVVVEDPDHESVSDSFTVTVTSVNDAPSATDDDGISLDEDTNIVIDVLANDADAADGDALSISSCGDAQNGTTLVVLDKIRYTPDKDFVGEDSFTYTVSDGNGATATATVTVSVLNVNDAPVALDDTASVSEDGSVTIPVMDNDSDIDHSEEIDPEETVTVSGVSSGTNGTTKIVGNAIVYQPVANFFGTDSFTYTISDHDGSSDTATVSVTVVPEADAPVFLDLSDSYTINEDTSANEIVFSIRDVETPADSLMLQAASATTAKIAQSGISISGLGDDLDAVKLRITPVANQYGDATIVLSLGDGFTTVQRSVTIHIQNVNDAPRTVADTVTFDEGTAYVDISISALLSNDSDIEGDALSFGAVLTQPGSGEIRQTDANTLRYTPVADFDGETSFTYSVSDGTDTTTATCRLVANGINDAPTIVFAYDSATTAEDTQSAAIPFTVSDKETPDGDLLLIAASSDSALVSPDGVSITNNGDGTGTLRIQPQADANGTLTIFLTVSDGEAQSSDSIECSIDPAADAPVGENDEIYVLYTGSCTFGVLGNDHDIDGDVLSVVKHTATGLPGTLTFDSATQQFTYAPAVGENGDPTFEYIVWDGTNEDTATVTLHVRSVTHDPVLSPVNSQYVLEDGTISGIAFFVSDEDAGDIFEISVASGDESKFVADDEHAVINNLGAGKYTLSLTPVADRSGLVTVTLTATDSAENQDSTTFTLHILAQNDAPVAVSDTVQLNEDGSAVLDLLDKDSDADGDLIWVTSVSTPTHGYLTRSHNVITYTPYGEWSGTESLSYAISDGRASAEATVTLTVLPVNDAPVAWNDYVELPNEIGRTASEINVIYNDRDPDGDAVHIDRIESQPSFGTASINPDGTILYRRTAVSTNSNGADSFTYSIVDRADASAADALTATATVYIGIDFTSSLNTYGRTVTCFEDCDEFEFTLDVSNPTPVDYTLTFQTACTLGTLSVKPGTSNTVQFKPNANAYGYQAISYTVANAENTEHDTGTIWLTVYPVNDAPQIDSAPETVSAQEDAATPATFDVTFHDIDCDLTDLHFYVYTRSASTGAPIVFQTGYTTKDIANGKTVTVKPLANVNGSAVIVVGVSDGFTYAEETIDLTVTPQDDAPVLNDINRTIQEDSSVRFAALPSDYEVDGDGTDVSINSPSHGTAALRADNTILYTPNANYYGTDTFEITVTDQTTAEKSSTALVTISVLSVNDPPAISDLAYYQTTAEDTAKVIPLTVIDADNDMTASGSYTFHSSDESVVKQISISHGTGNEMQITATPVANASGTVLISVTATDGALSANGAFLLKVTPVNDTPTAVNDAATVEEAVYDGSSASAKTTAVMNLIENDSDVESGTLRIVAITNVKNGAVVNTGGGEVTVSANGDFNGEVTFSYTVMDVGGEMASANAKLIITPSNDPPRAAGDSVTIDEDARPIIAVLENDSDPEDEALSLVAVSDPAHGAAYYVGANVYYIPEKDYNGKDSFTYTVADASGAIATATISVTIRPLNDAPEISKYPANSGEWTMLEDTPKSFHFDVSDAESPDSNLIIRIASKDESRIKTSQIQLSTNESGYKTIYVVPNTNAHDTVYLDFSVSDGLETTTVTYPITIQSVNDAPVVTPLHLLVKEDTPRDAALTATDADGNRVSFSLVAEHPPIHGAVNVNEDGSFRYTPSDDYNGFDLFEVAADDGQAENNIGKAYITIEVQRENDPPTANDDSISILEDTPSEIDVLNNDTDEDIAYGDELTILRISSAPTKGVAQISSGKVVYTPALNQNGTDTFSYVVADQDGKLDSAEVTVTIAPVNDAPANGNDTAQVNEDTAISISVLENDDVDEITNPDWENLTIGDIEQPTNGTATINTNGQGITYTPKANYFSPTGMPDVFYYTVSDRGTPALSARFSVSVTVLPVNDAPTILAATESGLFANVTMDEDTVSGTIAFTVFDVEDAENELTVAVTHNNGDLLPAITATPNASGSCSFVIDSFDNKVGTATITVRVTDKGTLSAQKTFTVEVEPVNDAPNPQNDAYSVAEGGAITRDVLINDDVDTLTGNGGDTLTLLGFIASDNSMVTTLATTFGTATVVDNQLVYTHTATTANKGIYTDSFQYRMKETDDTSGNTYTATVVVSIAPYNDAPEIEIIPITVSIQEDTPNGTGEISFSVMDEEDDDDGLVIITKTSSNTTLVPLSNIIIINPDSATDTTGTLRTVKVIPALNQFGTATITLTVRDTEGRTASDTFTVTVTAVNDAPADGDDTASVNEDTAIMISVLANDDSDLTTNPATEHLTITDVTQPANGAAAISLDGQKITYTPKANYFSPTGTPDVFTYTMKDAANQTATFSVSVTVLPVNDAPTIDYRGQESYTVSEGVAVENILFYIDDVDHNTDLSVSASEVTVTAKSSNTILLKIENGITLTNGEGKARYISLQPNGEWNGTASITITATDKAGAKATHKFTLVVSNVNKTPVAVADNLSVLEDAVTNVNVLANDTDADLITNPSTEAIFVHSVSTESENADVSIATNGKSVVVDPIDNFNGVFTFTYTIADAAGAVSEPVVSAVSVSQVNDAPTPGNDDATTNEDTPKTIDVLTNDTDVDSDTSLNATPVYTKTVVGVGLATHGTASYTAGDVTYTPAANFNGTDSFTYTVSDGALTATATVSITVDQVNDNPTAVKDVSNVDEDHAASKNVVANDTDVDTEADKNLAPGALHSLNDLSVSSIQLASGNGVASRSGNTITFTPTANWFGQATVLYTLIDGHGGTTDGVYEINVASVNDLPLFATPPANMTLTEDSDNGSSAIAVTDVETPYANLNVTYRSSSNTALADGSCVSITSSGDGNRLVTVNPKDNQNGTAQIKLRVTDGNGGYSEYIFTVTVSAVNDDPTAGDTSATTPEDTAKTIDVASLIGDADIATNGDVIIVSVAEGNGPAHGSYALSGTQITYTPAANFNGADSIAYTVTDKALRTATGTISLTVSPVNDAPTPGNDDATTNEDTPKTIDVLTNDTDVDSDTSLNATPVYTKTVVGVGLATHGTASYTAGDVTYTPAANFNGTDSFTYTVSDGALTATATVSITVDQVNDNPTAVKDVSNVDEDHAASMNVVANDTDVDTEADKNLAPGALHSLNDLSVSSIQLASGNGVASRSGNTITFTPTANWFGQATVLYTLIDGHGGTTDGVYEINVASVNDLPLFATPPANMTLTEDSDNGSSAIAVTDVETPYANLNVTYRSSSNTALADGSCVSITSSGDGNRLVTVNPKDNQNGTAQIKLRVTDGNGGYSEYTFTVTVSAVNDDPTAGDTSATTAEDTAKTIDVASLIGDADIATNGDVITVSVAEGNGPAHGSYTLNGTQITYTPAANFNGADGIAYTVTDKALRTATGTISLTVSPVNDAPVPGNDDATTNEDTPKTIDVLTNDTDVDSDTSLNATPVYTKTVVGVGLAAHGTASYTAGDVTYKPAANFNGTDSFTYTVSDGALSATATVSITVSQVNDNPTAQPDTTTTPEDTKVTYNVLDNDEDVDTDETRNLATPLHLKTEFSITKVAFSGAENGAVSFLGGSVTYTPSVDFVGTQVISYEMSDGHGGYSTSTLSVIVGSEDDAPVAGNDTMNTTEDHAVTINVLDNDRDSDIGDTLRFAGFKGSVSSLPGTFATNVNGTVTFTPRTNYNGTFTVDYYVSDSTNLTDLATITVSVSAVNDDPVALGTSVTTPEDTAKTIDVASLISDADIETNEDAIAVSIEEGNGPAHGGYTLSGTQITYTPKDNFNGADSITYTVTDSLGKSDTGTISITISPVNDKPVALDNSAETPEDTLVTIHVLSNDLDVDTDSLLNAQPDDAITIASVGSAAHGTARIVDGQITYLPDKNYNGTDSFTYTVTDNALTATARVSISIAQVNDAIEAEDDETSTTDEDPIEIDVLSNDSDADTDEANNLDALHSRSDFMLTAVGAASSGTTKIANGKIVYTPSDRFAGEDSFTYTVSDGHGANDTATVSVTVFSVNDAPTIVEVGKPKEGAKAIPPDPVEVAWTAFDIDGDEMTYSLEYFDGKGWLPAASGLKKAEYAFAIPSTLASTNGLKFRVTANDGSLTSEYGYSGAIKVDKDAPTGSVVTMRTADGRAYTAGTWTNQNVTVQASSAVDASAVVYYYSMDGAAEEAGNGMTVTGGVHSVFVTARDEFKNQTALGEYLARVDKQPPAVPQMRESILGANVLVSFTLQADPGGSGNDTLILPDGQTLKASANLQFAAAKNGTYTFTLVDAVGNRKTFTYTVGSADTTKPQITYASGAYRVGTRTLDDIAVTLTFSDLESAIVTRGYQLSASASAGGAYRNYDGAISILDAGTYYIHAFAKNAFGIAAYETFGPFILENEAAGAGATPAPLPPSGSVVVTKEDVEETPGETVAIRLPGKEWSETLTLEDVSPGDYLVEVMDAEGNVRTVTLHVTSMDIVARSLKTGNSPAAIIALAVAAAAGLLLLLLFAGYNVIVTVVSVPFTAEKKIRAMRRIMFARREFVIKLERRHIQGGRFARIKIAKQLTKKLRGSWIIVQLQGLEVLREQVPEDANEPFRRKITLE